MALCLRPLAIYASHRNSQLVSVSKILTQAWKAPSSAAEVNAGPSKTSKPDADTESDSAPDLHRIVQANNLDILGADGLLLETKYGLRVELGCFENVHTVLGFVAGASKSVLHPVSSLKSPFDSASKSEAHDVATSDVNNDKVLQTWGTNPPSANQYHFRLFADWGTTFLWHNTKLPHPPGEYPVDDEEIESWFPTLEPSYFAWVDTYNEAFETQECHLGQGHVVFPDVSDEIAWETEGFLLACRLVLQDGVESVQYEVDFQEYQITKRSMAIEFLEFLKYVDSKI